MRLKWLDRIRRLAHLGRPVRTAGSAGASDSQGRHRRSGRRPSADGSPSGGDNWSATGQIGPSRGAEGVQAGVGSRPAGNWPAPEDSREASEYGLPPGSSGAAVLDPAVRSAGSPQPLHGGGTRERRGILGGSGQPAVRGGAARARMREAPGDMTTAAEGVRAARAATRARPQWVEQAASGPAQAVGVPDTQVTGVVSGVPQQSIGRARPLWRARLPFAAPHARDRPPTADGRRNCGSLEGVLWRQWDVATAPPVEVVEAIDRLAELPEKIKERLADGLDAIFVGPGGVPELDEMTGLRGVRLPSGRASWDACAGAYGGRKIVVGSQPSPTPDVMCHEVGHALDDLDSPPGKWQSDSAEFRRLYELCQPHLASDFHRQPGGLGRKEFFADAFAAIASRQRPALVDMLGGDTRTALWIMLYFNRRYGI